MTLQVPEHTQRRHDQIQGFQNGLLSTPPRTTFARTNIARLEPISPPQNSFHSATSSPIPPTPVSNRHTKQQIARRSKYFREQTTVSLYIPCEPIRSDSSTSSDLHPLHSTDSQPTLRTQHDITTKTKRSSCGRLRSPPSSLETSSKEPENSSLCCRRPSLILASSPNSSFGVAPPSQRVSAAYQRAINSPLLQRRLSLARNIECHSDRATLDGGSIHSILSGTSEPIRLIDPTSFSRTPKRYDMTLIDSSVEESPREKSGRDVVLDRIISPVQHPSGSYYTYQSDYRFISSKQCTRDCSSQEFSRANACRPDDTWPISSPDRSGSLEDSPLFRSPFYESGLLATTNSPSLNLSYSQSDSDDAVARESMIVVKRGSGEVERVLEKRDEETRRSFDWLPTEYKFSDEHHPTRISPSTSEVYVEIEADFSKVDDAFSEERLLSDSHFESKREDGVSSDNELLDGHATSIRNEYKESRASLRLVKRNEHVAPSSLTAVSTMSEEGASSRQSTTNVTRILDDLQIHLQELSEAVKVTRENLPVISRAVNRALNEESISWRVCE